MVVLLRCMWLFGVVLSRTASPVAVGCGCNEHGSLGAVVNRSFLPETSENVLQNFEPPSHLEKALCSTLMSAGRDAVFPHTLLPHVNAPTTSLGPHMSPKHLKPGAPGWVWMWGRMMCSLLWVVSVEDSRQPDRSNLCFPRNSACYFAAPLPFCRERLEMVPVREPPLASLQWGENSMPQPRAENSPRSAVGIFCLPGHMD